MSQPELTIASGEDRPIVVGGGPNMITIQLPDSSAGKGPRTFTVTPKDPAVPFKEIVVTEGANEVFRIALNDEWKVTIA